jgi:hypothetical protein
VREDDAAERPSKEADCKAGKRHQGPGQRIGFREEHAREDQRCSQAEDGEIELFQHGAETTRNHGDANVLFRPGVCVRLLNSLGWFRA